uniref:Uncharacterized protein n=1 Tax=Coturnix japonica TaxID=93934 RepID=A0A8C2T8S7_COTJA
MGTLLAYGGGGDDFGDPLVAQSCHWDTVVSGLCCFGVTRCLWGHSVSLGSSLSLGSVPPSAARGRHCAAAPPASPPPPYKRRGRGYIKPRPLPAPRAQSPPGNSHRAPREARTDKDSAWGTACPSMPCAGSRGGVKGRGQRAAVRPRAGQPRPADGSMEEEQRDNDTELIATTTPIRGLKTPIEALKTPIGDLKTPRGNLTTPIGDLKTPIDTLKTPIGDSTTPMETLKTRIEDLKTPMETLRTPIGDSTTPIGALRTPIENITTPIGDLKTPIETLKTPIETLKNPIGGSTNPMEDLTTPKEDITTPIGDITTPIGDITTPIGDITTPIGGLKGFAERFLQLERDHIALLKELPPFGAPVSHVYSPLDYAWEPHRDFVSRYCRGPKRILFLGMNPGPFGMAQTGVRGGMRGGVNGGVWGGWGVYGMGEGEIGVVMGCLFYGVCVYGGIWSVCGGIQGVCSMGCLFYGVHGGGGGVMGCLFYGVCVYGGICGVCSMG